MGAWGIRNFENDGATDFVEDVIDGNKRLIANTIERVLALGKEDFLGLSDCEEALAAIEFIAAAKQRPSADVPEEVLQWLKQNDILSFKDFDLIASSQEVIEQVLDNSDLKELWVEKGEGLSWEKVIADLRNRIS